MHNSHQIFSSALMQLNKFWGLLIFVEFSMSFLSFCPTIALCFHLSWLKIHPFNCTQQVRTHFFFQFRQTIVELAIAFSEKEQAIDMFFGR